MKHLIILSGNSLKNKAWGEAVAEHYSSHFDSAFMLEYDHWQSGEKNIDLNREEEKLRNHIATLPPETAITIMAKSAGSLLAFTVINNGTVTPTACAFFGIPFDLAANDLFKDNWGPVEAFSIPAIAFHNIDDPTTSYEFTKETLERHAPHIRLITTHEHDHWYGDLATYDQYLSDLMIQE